MLKAHPRKAAAGRGARTIEPRRSKRRASTLDVCIGVLVGWDARGPLVNVEGSSAKPTYARVSGHGSQLRPGSHPERLADLKPEVVLLIDSRPGRPPILMGLIQPIGSAVATAGLEARVDGRRVELEAADEVVLRCGEASITLRRNGRVAIHGVQVETRARGTNRIKGGSVAIN